MNRRLTNDTLQRRKLVLRREVITALTLPQLRQLAAAGSGEWWPCGGSDPAPLPGDVL